MKNAAEILDPWLNEDPCEGCSDCERVCRKVAERIDRGFELLREELKWAKIEAGQAHRMVASLQEAARTSQRERLMIKVLTHEQVKEMALNLKLPMCDCGCDRPSWRVMEFYWDIANAIKKLNEKNDD